MFAGEVVALAGDLADADPSTCDRDGLADLVNLLPLCNTHHHLVHEGGWRLALHPDRTIVLTRPDGTIHFEASTVDVGPRGVDTTEVETVSMARARARALGPPSRAPAA